MRFNIRKTISILLAMCTAIVMISCSSESDTESKKDESSSESVSSSLSSSVELGDLREAMLDADDTLPNMSLASSDDENGEELFAYLADYDYEKVEEYFFSYAATGTAEEIAVIKLVDEDAAKDCADAVKDHVESRIVQFETYDPTQVPRCEEAVVFYNDSYVVLIICDNDEAVKDAFYNAFE